MIGCCSQASFVCAGSSLFVGSPLQNFHAPWGEPFTLSDNTGLDHLTQQAVALKAVRFIFHLKKPACKVKNSSYYYKWTKIFVQILLCEDPLIISLVA